MSTDILHAAMHALPAHVALVDASGAVIWVNAAWRACANADAPADHGGAAGPTYLLARDTAETSAEIAAEAAAGVRAVLAGERAEFTLDYPCHTPAGSRWFRMLARPLDGAGGAVIMHVDISDHVAARLALEQQVQELALVDSLTGLPNRVLLNDRFEQALLNSSRSIGRLAVLYMDIDGFVEINDRLGRQAGDELLAEVGRRLRPALRAGDTAARYGSDEFVILLLDIRSPEEAMAVAKRIVQAFDEPFALSRGVVSVRASIGVAVEWSHLHTVEALLGAAEHALRLAKRLGTGRVVLFDGEGEP